MLFFYDGVYYKRFVFFFFRTWSNLEEELPSFVAAGRVLRDSVSRQHNGPLKHNKHTGDKRRRSQRPGRSGIQGFTRNIDSSSHWTKQTHLKTIPRGRMRPPLGPGATEWRRREGGEGGREERDGASNEREEKQ